MEACLSDEAKAPLADADVTDMAMVSAGHMFELRAQVQVRRRGTLFAARAARLAAVFGAYPSLEAMPAAERTALETETLGAAVADIWTCTREFGLRARAVPGRRHRDTVVPRSRGPRP
ncbi:hypothetical protein [Streptomyces sp. NBC_01435]|uniref:hypothetical protein n=1 Tax=Streptomyces sp. NBC_01435 TaxID=2903865 RepID=UPI002E374FEC|nr:hypothetical protein [Streptomyces sp. NBC_01435]